MKKASLIVLPFLLGLAYAQPLLRVESVRAPAGVRVVVPIVIQGTADVSSFQFRLNFDRASVSLAPGDPVLRGDRLTDHVIVTHKGEDAIDVFVFSSSFASLKDEPGTVAQLILQTGASVPAQQNLLLNVTQVLAFSPEGAPIQLDGAPGYIQTVGSLDEMKPPVEGQNRRFFPQLAEGTSTAGDMRFALILTNQTEATVSGRVRFYLPDGTPFVIDLQDGRTGAEFTYLLEPRGSIRLAGKAQGALKIGYGMLEASGPTSGTLVLSSVSGGVTRSELGVTASGTDKLFSFSPQYRAGEADTGVALVNPGSSSVSGVLILRDTSGEERERISLTLAPGEHRASFVTEFFPSLVESGEFLGAIDLVFDRPIAVLGLRQSYQQFLTTIPVF